MTSTETALVLTDDEIAAIAHLAHGAWLRPLPTVDSSTVAAVRAAVARGLRSLELRGLAGEESGLDVSLAPVVAVVDRQPVVTVVSVDQDGATVPDVERIELFVLPDDSGVALVTTPHGVHHVAAVDPVETASEFGQLLEPAGDGDGARFALLLRRRDGEVADSYLGGTGTPMVMRARAGVRSAPTELVGTFDWAEVVGRLLQPDVATS